MQTVTRRIAALLGGEGYPQCESPSLRLEKYVNITPEDKAERTSELNAVIRCYARFAKTLRMVWSNKRESDVEVIAHPKGNLIVNQSGGILENAGLCLDRFHGYPYIPGSAIKGVCSKAAYLEWSTRQDEALAKRIVDVFGFPTGHGELDERLRTAGQMEALAGHVSFLAAMPLGQCELALDIATPHHPEYYQGKRMEATDDEAPIPLAFPVVKAGGLGEFVFRLFPLRGATEQMMTDARHWLEEALTVYGLGAKTAAGFGWFAIGHSPEWHRKNDARLALQAEKAAQEKERQDKDDEEQRKREEQRKKHAAEVAAAQAAILAQSFAKFNELNWKKFSSEVTGIYKASGECFDEARRQELYKAILDNHKIKLKDLQGGVKSLDKWLGGELKEKLLKEKQ